MFALIYEKYKDKVARILFNKIAIRPWMQKTEIDIIEDIILNLQPDNSLEWGAGYSTIYFAKFLQKGAEWISIEHDRDWAQKIYYHLQFNPVFQRYGQHEWLEFYLRGQLSEIGLKTFNRLIRVLKTKNKKPGIKIFHVLPDRFPWTDVHGDGSYSDLKDYIEFPSKFGYFDFILVDGRARRDCLIKAYEIVKDKGVVVLHDAGRKYYHEPFELYKYQILFIDNRKDEVDLWIGSKGLKISDILDVDKHRKIWHQ